MKDLRCLFPVALLGVALVSPTWAQEAPVPAKEARPAGIASETPLLSGPMLGYAAPRSVAVWLQTRRAAQVQLRYMPAGSPDKARLTPATTTSAEETFALTVVLDGLEPGTRYDYELYLDGKLTPRPYPLNFRTRTLWRYRLPDPPQATVLLGSCSYVNQPQYDRPGKHYGGDYQIFQSMAATSRELGAEAMLWLGDNVYLREVDYETAEGIEARYRHDRALPEMQSLLASTFNYATWDDHDYGPNDSDKTYLLKDAALAAFKRYWPAVRYGQPEAPGVYQRFEVSDAEFFVLDDRYYRAPNSWPVGPDKRCLGQAQLNWLKAALVASKATWKIVANGNQVLNRRCKHEDLGDFADRKELLSWIKDQKIEGVVFLSGDRHHTEIIRREEEGMYPLYDFTSSPLTSGAHGPDPDSYEGQNPERVAGTLVRQRNYGVLRFLGSKNDRRIEIQTRGVDGKVLWTKVIKRSALSFPQDPADEGE